MEREKLTVDIRHEGRTFPRIYRSHGPDISARVPAYYAKETTKAKEGDEFDMDLFNLDSKGLPILIGANDIGMTPYRIVVRRVVGLHNLGHHE